MKRWLSLCLCCILAACLLCSCRPRSPVEKETLNYPGLSWGMSPQEVISALHLREDQVQSMDDDSSFRVGYIPEDEIFGLKPANIIFDFIAVGSEQKLYKVSVTYPEGSSENIGTVKTSLEEYDGTLQEEVILGPNTLLPDPDPEAMTVFQNQPNGDEFYWVSDRKLRDLSWTEEEASRAQKHRQEQAPSEDFWKDDECWKAYMETDPLVTIYLSNVEHAGHVNVCQISFSADYIGYEQLNAQ